MNLQIGMNLRRVSNIPVRESSYHHISNFPVIKSSIAPTEKGNYDSETVLTKTSAEGAVNVPCTDRTLLASVTFTAATSAHSIPSITSDYIPHRVSRLAHFYTTKLRWRETDFSNMPMNSTMGYHHQMFLKTPRTPYFYAKTDMLDTKTERVTV